MPPSPENPHKDSFGPLIGIVIILFLIVAGALYFWSVRGQRDDATIPYIPSGSTSTTTVQ